MEPAIFPDEAGFRTSLEANHVGTGEILVGFWKKGSGKPLVTSAKKPGTRAKRLSMLIERSVKGEKILGYDIGRKK